MSADPKWACTRTDEHCRYCGRALIETVEPGLFNSDTGEREMERWHSCPRYLAPWWKAAFLPGWGAPHQSHNVANPLIARQWR